MDTLLRVLAGWKARRKSAQIIVFDGGAEVERARSFLRGALAGVGISMLVFLLTAPGLSDPRLVEELDRRGALIEEANQRIAQAVEVAAVCLSTARRMEQTLASYQSFLGADVPSGTPRLPGALPAAAAR
jgi:hypothetical protein